MHTKKVTYEIPFCHPFWSEDTKAPVVIRRVQIGVETEVSTVLIFD